jgi:hypothetical protein
MKTTGIAAAAIRCIVPVTLAHALTMNEGICHAVGDRDRS